jgi:CHAD domain-containing protein
MSHLWGPRKPTLIMMTDAEKQQHDQSQHESSMASRTINAAEPMIVFAFECLRDEYAALVEHRPPHGEIPTPDAVHRTRIAARRLRVALRLFKDVLPRNVAESLSTELQWFARALGEVRDLDVYSERLSSYLSAAADATPLLAYWKRVEDARAEARARLPGLFDDPRYAALLRAFAEFLEDAPAPGALRRWRSLLVSDGAQAYLEASVKRMLKRGNKIDVESPAEELHRLRITGKRLRYELEFFAEVYPSLAKSAKAVRRLQDVLGEHQDACAASARLSAYQSEAGTNDSLTALARAHEQQGVDAQRRFAAEWQRFKKTISLGELRTLLAA